MELLKITIIIANIIDQNFLIKNNNDGKIYGSVFMKRGITSLLLLCITGRNSKNVAMYANCTIPCKCLRKFSLLALFPLENTLNSA